MVLAMKLAERVSAGIELQGVSLHLICRSKVNYSLKEVASGRLITHNEVAPRLMGVTMGELM